MERKIDNPVKQEVTEDLLEPVALLTEILGIN